MRSNPFAWAVLRRVIIPRLLKDLDSVRFIDTPTDLDTDRPLLVLANHTSWWDGFLVHELVRRVRPKAPLYTIMLERELGRARFLRWTGCIGIEPGDPGTVRRAVNTVRALASEEPTTAVQFFPQGAIGPSRARPLGFKEGYRLVARALGEASILPVGIHLELFNRRKPTAFVVCAPPFEGATPVPSAEQLEARIGAALDDLNRHLDRWGEHWATSELAGRLAS